jgi:hypothetical protein
VTFFPASCVLAQTGSSAAPASARPRKRTADFFFGERLQDIADGLSHNGMKQVEINVASGRIDEINGHWSPPLTMFDRNLQSPCDAGHTAQASGNASWNQFLLRPLPAREIGRRVMTCAMTCACCRNDISPLAAWKGQSEQFYCSEFCAEVETADIVRPLFEPYVPERRRA